MVTKHIEVATKSRREASLGWVKSRGCFGGVLPDGGGGGRFVFGHGADESGASRRRGRAEQKRGAFLRKTEFGALRRKSDSRIAEGR